MTKCLGCGATIQDKDSSLEGFSNNIDNKYCERCFRIKHYNDYILNNKGNEEYLKKIDYINKTRDLVVLVTDFLNIIDFDSLNISNPVLLVFTKKDLLPRSVIESKFLSRIKCGLNVVDTVFVSSKNNYNLDVLYSKINKFKKSKNVYVVGLTNAGKSTLINKILKNYSSFEGDITVSNLPSTTLDFLEKKASDDLTLIDTPGLLDDGNIIFKIDKDLLKKITPSKEINPIIYQIKCMQSIIVENIFRLDLFSKNNVIFYMSNSLCINRIYKENDKLSNFKKHTIKVNDNQDLVIKGLGFIKFKYGCTAYLYLMENVSFFVRDSLV